MDEDSDIFAISETNREGEEPSEKYIGRDAFKHYYKKYKRYSVDPQNCRDSASTAFIKECKALNLNPVPLGLIKRKGKADEIKINYLQIGGSYLKALTKSMKQLDLKEVNIHNIKENEPGIINVIETLKKTCESLKFVDSNLGPLSIEKIWEWMEKQNFFGCLNLKTLVISNSRLIDNISLNLMKGLWNSVPSLKELDLSKNKIGDKSIKLLGEFVTNAYSLEKVNLKWNIISAKGVIPLLEGLYLGRSCKNLNLAYNWLSRGESLEFIEALIKNIDQNLVHLDLSQNNLSALTCSQIGELIKDNHSLYGIHMHGNNWYVDGFGFIRVDYFERQFQYSKNIVISPKSWSGFSPAIHYSK